MSLKVTYTGTNVGKIYLSDIGKRYQLGGGREGDYFSSSGQDRYIIWGETLVLQASGEVLMSYANGILKYFSTESSSTAFASGVTGYFGPPLTIVSGSYTSADESPRVDIGVTSGSRFTDAYLARLGDAKFSTGAAGTTGYYMGGSF